MPLLSFPVKALNLKEGGRNALLKGTFSIKCSVTDTRAPSLWFWHYIRAFLTISPFMTFLFRRLSQCDHVASKNDDITGRNWNSCGSQKKLFLCCSAITTPERVKQNLLILFIYFVKEIWFPVFPWWLELQETVFKFERLSGVTVLKKWDSCVTHVIASTDENGACKRTLKVLMGILEGKWILNMECKYYSETFW